MKLLVPIFVISSYMYGQAPAGIAAAWDVSQSAAALSAQAARLKPILQQVDAQGWIAKGAPESYVAQWQSAQEELEYLTSAAGVLQKQPEKLSAAVDTYFRLQSLEWRLQSLMEGIRKYQDSEVADRLAQAMGGNSSNRDNLRKYITDLTKQQEQELAVVSAEAQRCRVEANHVEAHQDAAPATKKKAK